MAEEIASRSALIHILLNRRIHPLPQISLFSVARTIPGAIAIAGRATVIAAEPLLASALGLNDREALALLLTPIFMADLIAYLRQPLDSP